MDSPRKGYIHFKNPRDATSALQLHNIPFMGQNVRLERPLHWNGPEHFKAARRNWKDRLCRATSKEKNNEDNWNKSGVEDPCDLKLMVRDIPKGYHEYVPNYITSVMKQLGMLNGNEEAIRGFQPYRKNPAQHYYMGFFDVKHARDVRNVFCIQNLPFADKYLKFHVNTAIKETFPWTTIKIGIVCSIKGFFFNTTETEEVLTLLKSKQQSPYEIATPTNSPTTVRECNISHKLTATLAKPELDLAKVQKENKRLILRLKERQKDVSLLENALKNKDSELVALSKRLQQTKENRQKTLEENRQLVMNAAPKPTEIIQNNSRESNNDFLRKELERKQKEIDEKSERIRELEKSNERHLERILNLTDGMLVQGSKQRKLEKELERERNTRKAFEINRNRKSNAGAAVSIMKEEEVIHIL
eukprot:CAMPEP_0178938514 /NCGR_PEP_ID=MMETSP0786-20121207/26372_1 /TAXON_ID=186022 /ORGANISM="Thalassionema frauenfeldii, Strain CCMP 1798" /LENGTH=416 /DNA_ID=CAMNT_0020617239 /DNA_START=188 /DNA_END=1439 /DNA_ORIENTATION=-